MNERFLYAFDTNLRDSLWARGHVFRSRWTRGRLVAQFILGGLLTLGVQAQVAPLRPDEPTGEIARAQALIARVLPTRAGDFVCELIPADADRDVFEYEAGPGTKITLRGNQSGSLAVAFNQYLRHEARLDFDWLAAGPLRSTAPLPRPVTKVRRTTLAKERFFLNYCTYGYTMPWWGWPQWERFLDWMAMNGINRPLLQAGQEAVWLRVWESYGLKPDAIRRYFSGPAHLPWHRMANLDRWGGPLPMSYIDGQAQLQKNILARARALAMQPILCGFAGHVPRELAELRPSAKVTPIEPGWSGMSAEFATSYLDPRDPLFAEIQGRFLREQSTLYGTDHLYAADPFNEMPPPSWDPAYLASVGESIFSGMVAADPSARWYQMSWTFTYDKRWTAPRMAAMLRSVPRGKMVLLDYACEEQELYPETENCYGLPFIWNYLGNFGGNTHLMAPLRKIDDHAGRALTVPNCIGVGSTLEAIGVNPVGYALLFELPWRDHAAPDLQGWIKDYADQRAGGTDPAVEAAWAQLGSKVFIDNSRRKGSNGAIFQALPKLKQWHGRRQHAETDYLPADLVSAMDQLFKATATSRVADGYRYDVVNLTRQTLCDLGQTLYDRMQSAVERQDLGAFKKEAATFIEVGRDLDDLLATRHEFLLGAWLTEARQWGRTPAEADYYEENAREILTSWHRPGGQLTDYASRQWNGLLRSYYLPRWQKWIELEGRALEQGMPFPEQDYIAWINEACSHWIKAHGESYPAHPKGDPVNTAEKLFRKYRDRLAPAQKTAGAVEQPDAASVAALRF